MSLSNSTKPAIIRVLLICMLMPAAFLLSTASIAQAAELSVEQRLMRMEAEKEIRDLIVLYGQYHDSKRYAEYSQLFAREGTWSGGTTNFVPVKGPEQIRETMEKAFADRVYDPEHIANVHLVTNIKIDFEGDQVTGYSKYTVMSRNEKDEPYVRVNGVYEDVYTREDGRWKFLSRVARREIP